MTEIKVTPDYQNLFRNMLEQARLEARARNLFGESLPPDLEPVALRTVQRFLAPLNIAAQCMVTTTAVEQFRDVLHQMVQDIDCTAARMERDLEEE